MSRLSTFLCALVFLALAACGSDDTAPSVAIATTAPLQIVPDDDALDDIVITVDYFDDDGDLGEGVAEIHDCRAAGLTTELPLPAIASDEAVDAGVPIAGVLELVLSDVGDVDIDAVAPAPCAALDVGAPVEGEARFCVVLVDAAGNAGVGDCTPVVQIVPAITD